MKNSGRRWRPAPGPKPACRSARCGSAPQQAEQDGQRHRDRGGAEGQEQRVPQPAGDGGADVLAAGQRRAEVAGQHAAQPAEIAHIGRVVEAELLAQVGERFRRGRLAEDGLRDVARQDLRADEDQHRDRQQQDEPQGDALRDELEDRRTHARGAVPCASWALGRRVPCHAGLLPRPRHFTPAGRRHRLADSRSSDNRCSSLSRPTLFGSYFCQQIMAATKTTAQDRMRHAVA